MKRIGIFVVVVIVAVGFKFWRRGNLGAEELAKMKTIIAKLPIYQSEGELLDEMVERHHGSAFDAAYEVGGRRMADTFDESRYFGNLVTRMMAEADQRKKTEVVTALKQLKDAVAAVQPSGGP